MIVADKHGGFNEDKFFVLTHIVCSAYWQCCWDMCAHAGEKKMNKKRSLFIYLLEGFFSFSSNGIVVGFGYVGERIAPFHEGIKRWSGGRCCGCCLGHAVLMMNRRMSAGRSGAAAAALGSVAFEPGVRIEGDFFLEQTPCRRRLLLAHFYLKNQ